MPYIPDLTLPVILPSAMELDLQRFLTCWYISCDPTEIILHTRVSSTTPQGGVTTVPGSNRPVQTFMMITPDAAGRTQNEDGVERSYDLSLLGKYDAAIDVTDWWEDVYGNKFEVLELLPFNGYEKRAVIKDYGKYPYAA